MQQDIEAILSTYGKRLIYELLPLWHFEETGKCAIVLVLEPLTVRTTNAEVERSIFLYLYL